MTKEITVTFRFRNEEDDGCFYLDLEAISGSGNLTPEEVGSITERWGQSDFYWVGIVNALLPAMEGTTIQAKDIEW